MRLPAVSSRCCGLEWIGCLGNKYFPMLSCRARLAFVSAIEVNRGPNLQPGSRRCGNHALSFQATAVTSATTSARS